MSHKLAHLGKVKNSPITAMFLLQDNHETTSWNAPEQTPSQKNQILFIWMFLFKVSACCLLQKSPKKGSHPQNAQPNPSTPNPSACQLASASALIAAFLARNSRFWASSKDSPCCRNLGRDPQNWMMDENISILKQRQLNKKNGHKKKKWWF